MTISFLASIEGASCIKFDGCKSGVVKLTIPASEVAAVAQLLTVTEQEVRVTIDAD